MSNISPKSSTPNDNSNQNNQTNLLQALLLQQELNKNGGLSASELTKNLLVSFNSNAPTQAQQLQNNLNNTSNSNGNNNSNFECDICKKTFNCNSALNVHYRSHTKERPYKCEICNKGFTTKGNMKQHQLTHKNIPNHNHHHNHNNPFHGIERSLNNLNNLTNLNSLRQQLSLPNLDLPSSSSSQRSAGCNSFSSQSLDVGTNAQANQLSAQLTQNANLLGSLLNNNQSNSKNSNTNGDLKNGILGQLINQMQNVQNLNNLSNLQNLLSMTSNQVLASTLASSLSNLISGSGTSPKNDEGNCNNISPTKRESTPIKPMIKSEINDLLLTMNNNNDSEDQNLPNLQVGQEKSIGKESSGHGEISKENISSTNNISSSMSNPDHENENDNETMDIVKNGNETDPNFCSDNKPHSTLLQDSPNTTAENQPKMVEQKKCSTPIPFQVPSVPKNSTIAGNNSNNTLEIQTALQQIANVPSLGNNENTLLGNLLRQHQQQTGLLKTIDLSSQNNMMDNQNHQHHRSVVKALPNQSLRHFCHACEKYFSSASSLQIHTRTHTGDRPFGCKLCAKKFTTKGNLKVHYGTHLFGTGGSRRGRRLCMEHPEINNWMKNASNGKILALPLAHLGKISENGYSDSEIKRAFSINSLNGHSANKNVSATVQTQKVTTPGIQNVSESEKDKTQLAISQFAAQISNNANLAQNSLLQSLLQQQQQQQVPTKPTNNLNNLLPSFVHQQLKTNQEELFLQQKTSLSNSLPSAENNNNDEKNKTSSSNNILEMLFRSVKTDNEFPKMLTENSQNNNSQISPKIASIKDLLENLQKQKNE